PNERVYAFILEAEPGILDEAMAQKVVMASPFSLYAILALVRQSFENFHFSQSMQDVLKKTAAFRQDFEKFQERFLKLGEQLEKSTALYREVAETSYRRLDQAFARIEALRLGGPAGAKENPVPEGDGVPGRA
ncbi:MAG TPA: DNA recombination protein RmuC, partial [Elusimicrobiota bacterium]|nr:DNA recombination protein RmuC [Elusimicrobiota bacterium]